MSSILDMIVVMSMTHGGQFLHGKLSRQTFTKARVEEMNVYEGKDREKLRVLGRWRLSR